MFILYIIVLRMDSKIRHRPPITAIKGQISSTRNIDKPHQKENIRKQPKKISGKRRKKNITQIKEGLDDL